MILDTSCRQIPGRRLRAALTIALLLCAGGGLAFQITPRPAVERYATWDATSTHPFLTLMALSRLRGDAATEATEHLNDLLKGTFEEDLVVPVECDVPWGERSPCLVPRHPLLNYVGFRAWNHFFNPDTGSGLTYDAIERFAAAAAASHRAGGVLAPRSGQGAGGWIDWVVPGDMDVLVEDMRQRWGALPSSLSWARYGQEVDSDLVEPVAAELLRRRRQGLVGSGPALIHLASAQFSLPATAPEDVARYFRDFSWNRALALYRAARLAETAGDAAQARHLRAEAYENLGHVLHVLQDLAVPAHTWDTVHNPDRFEEHCARHYHLRWRDQLAPPGAAGRDAEAATASLAGMSRLVRAPGQQAVWRGKVLHTFSKHGVELPSLEEYLRSMARIAHGNFYSDATIPGLTDPGADNAEIATWDAATARWGFTEEQLEAQANILLPIAIDYCAGLITHFHRVANGAWPPPVDALLVLDSSGSMKDTDPSRLRVEAAALFAARLRDTDRLGVLDFDNGQRSLMAIRQLAGEGRAELAAALHRVDAAGGTDIPAAIAAAAQLFGRLADRSEPRRSLVLLLSDGQDQSGAPPQGQGASLDQLGVQTFAIGLSAQAGAALLEQVAAETKGSYFAAPAAADLMPIFDRILAAGREQAVLLDQTEHIHPGATRSFEVALDSFLMETTATLSWAGSKLELDVVDAAGAAAAGIAVRRGPRHLVAVLPSNLGERVSLRVRAVDVPPEGESFRLAVQSDSPLRLALRFTQDRATVGETVVLWPEVMGAGADVRYTAEAELPDGTSTPLGPAFPALYVPRMAGTHTLAIRAEWRAAGQALARRLKQRLEVVEAPAKTPRTGASPGRVPGAAGGWGGGGGGGGAARWGAVDAVLVAVIIGLAVVTAALTAAVVARRRREGVPAASLIVTASYDGQRQGPFVFKAARAIRIGRDRRNDVVLRGDPTASRFHAILYWSHGELFFRDLGGRRGAAPGEPGGSDLRIAGHASLRLGNTTLHVAVGGEGGGEPPR
ncbi:MAG: VWA domain-containing protein [Candidatus Schekmanbacteria bacterium]|nr:VWA domain-containing protein [Candidatus Schekmanbacteria bacterium]